MKADILLINPPFTMPDKPYISIPTLSAYLKNKGLQVQGLDANIEFYRRFLSPDNLRRSQAHAHQRIVELNEQHELHAAEITEYFRLVEAIQAASQAGQKLFTLFEPYAGSNVEKFALFRIAIKLASSPYFPEGLEYLPGGAGYIRYISKQHKFSSRDIIASLASPTLYAQSLEEILLPVLDQYNPPVVGLSLAFPDQILPTFKCAQIIKRRFSDIHVTVGGSSVSCYLREFTNTRLFDFVDSFVLDDGEIALETLIREASSLRPDFSRVPGLIYLAGGQIRRNASAIRSFRLIAISSNESLWRCCSDCHVDAIGRGVRSAARNCH
jgi:anaerobic magnesium-protoporphyrin IX monomethyl ester cyclase